MRKAIAEAREDVSVPRVLKDVAHLDIPAGTVGIILGVAFLSA